MTALQDLPFLDLSAPGFSTRGPEVMAARARSWAARTPYGLAVLRHHEAGHLLRDRRLRQGSHNWPARIGLQGSFARFWCDSVIGREGPYHKTLRRVFQDTVTTERLDGLRPEFRRHAEGLVSGGTADFMSTFATPFSGRAICTLVSIDEANWPAIAGDATMLGRAMGLDGKSHEAAINAAHDRLANLARDLIAMARRGTGTGLVTDLFAAAQKFGVDDDALTDLIVIAIFGGVDTTRAQLGQLMGLFADHPDQWAALRADPSLAPRALDESLRHNPTTTWATRETTEAFDAFGTPLPAEMTVHVLVHATATDPNAQPVPSFDITCPRKVHFGFGAGAHHCLGQQVARTDISEALMVLSRRIRSVERAGPAETLPETGNTGPISLPLHLQPV